MSTLQPTIFDRSFFKFGMWIIGDIKWGPLLILVPIGQFLSRYEPSFVWLPFGRISTHCVAIFDRDGVFLGQKWPMNIVSNLHLTIFDRSFSNLVCGLLGTYWGSLLILMITSTDMNLLKYGCHLVFQRIALLSFYPYPLTNMKNKIK